MIGGLFSHNGGYIQRMHNGGIKSDERPAILQTGEGVLSRRDMANIGGRSGFDALRQGGMTINVPVNVEGGGNRLAAAIQKNVEREVKRTIREMS
jgi:hypothetical protein